MLVSRLEPAHQGAFFLLTETSWGGHLDAHTRSRIGAKPAQGCNLEPWESTRCGRDSQVLRAGRAPWQLTTRAATNASLSRRSPGTHSSPRSTAGSWSGSSAPVDAPSWIWGAA